MTSTLPEIIQNLKQNDYLYTYDEASTKQTIILPLIVPNYIDSPRLAFSKLRLNTLYFLNKLPHNPCQFIPKSVPFVPVV